MPRDPNRRAGRSAGAPRLGVLVLIGALPLTGVLAACGSKEPAPRMEPPPAAATTAVDSATPTTAPAPSPVPTPTATGTGQPTPSPATSRYAFPVLAKPVSYAHRHDHHDYPATDIFAACGSSVVAPASGTVLEVSLVDTFNPRRPEGAAKGGLSVSIRGDDGVRYYGSHLSKVLTKAGAQVEAGQQIGLVGQTGNSSNVCHLHFGISPPCAGTGDWWVRRGVVWPTEYLQAWQAGRRLSPTSKVQSWQRAHGCPAKPPAGA